MVISLLLVCSISGACLGAVYVLTYDKINAEESQKSEEAIKKVLPPFDKLEKVEVSLPEDPSNSLLCYLAYNHNICTGIAVNSSSNGFGGVINMMVGFQADGTLNKVQILKHSETPGLGSKMTDPSFYSQFERKHLDQFLLKVKKDGGEVDAITAATISSRAYCAGLQKSYEAFKLASKKLTKKNISPSNK